MKTIAVVGSGPSLLYRDLEYLHKKNIQSIGSGRIHVAFSKTKWRPSEILIGDFDFMEDPGADILKYVELGIHVHLRTGSAMLLNTQTNRTRVAWYGMLDKITLHPDCGHYWVHGGVEQLDPVPKEWHPPVICCYALGGQMAIQLAVLQGAERVILLGFEGEYKQTLPYFSSEYLPVPSYPEWKLEDLNGTYEDTWPFWYKELVEKQGIEIVNCSKHSTLDLFPKEKLKDII